MMTNLGGAQRRRRRRRRRQRPTMSAPTPLVLLIAAYSLLTKNSPTNAFAAYSLLTKNSPTNAFVPQVPSPQPWTKHKHGSPSRVFSAPAPDDPTITSNASGDRTYYDILGLPPTADRSELKRQYRKLARLSHPDALINSSSSSTSTTSTTTPSFHEISTAYSILSDPKSRQRYDRSLQADQFVESTVSAVENVGGAVVDNLFVPFFSGTQKAVTAAARAVTVAKQTTQRMEEARKKKREREEAQRRAEEREKVERLKAMRVEADRREAERARVEAEQMERERLEFEQQQQQQQMCVVEQSTQEAEREARAMEEQQRELVELAAIQEMKELKEMVDVSVRPDADVTAIGVDVPPQPQQQTEPYDLQRAIQVSKDEHNVNRRSVITKPSTRRHGNTAKEQPAKEPYDLEEALRISRTDNQEANSGFLDAQRRGGLPSRKRRSGRKKKKGRGKRR